MTRLHFVQKARKANPNAGIAVGDSYYWWQFAFQGKRYSKTRPPRSSLTQSTFLGTLYDIEDDQIAKLEPDDGLEAARDDIAQAFRDLAEDCQNSFDNLPEQFQSAPVGETLQERIDGCNNIADEFDSIEFDGKGDDETEEEYWERKLEEIQAVSIDVG